MIGSDPIAKCDLEVFRILTRVHRRRSSAANNQPKADRPEVGTHLSGPFPVVCPIKDGNMGGDGGGCLVVRHYEKTKFVSYWSNYRVGGLRYCRNIVLSAYYLTNKHQGAPMVVPDYQTPD